MTTIIDRFGVSKPKIVKYPRSVECVNPNLVIGAELETENLNGDIDYNTLVKPFNMKVETDGSLRGRSAEFITLPMRSTDALAAFADYFKSTKFTEENYSDRCSVHIHVNCTDLEAEQVSSVALLYTVVEEVLFEFVGRDRDSNIYCIPWNQCRSHYNMVHSFLADSHSVLKRWSKYTAVNLLPLSTQGTMEFRQLHGTADMTKLTTWINIIGALFKYGTEHELKDLMSEIKELNSNSQYESFFKRILADQLPYSPAYQEKMEAGVILAKYGMLGMEKKTPKAKAAEKIKTVAMEAMAVDAAPLGVMDAVGAIGPMDRVLARLRDNERANRFAGVAPQVVRRNAAAEFNDRAALRDPWAARQAGFDVPPPPPARPVAWDFDEVEEIN